MSEVVKRLRKERKDIRNVIALLKDPGIPLDNRQGSARRHAICTLLMICANPDRDKLNPDVVKAALELYSYNDRVAVLLLEAVVECDYKTEIRKAKRR